MATELTLGDILRDDNPHSVAAYRTRSQLRTFMARHIAKHRAKATALHRQKLEVAAAIRRQRQQTTLTAGKSPLQHSPSLLNRRLRSPQTTSSQVLRTRLT
ncbi:hypothetical protein MRX96_045695 [Rhipicephalus microplus]